MGETCAPAGAGQDSGIQSDVTLTLTKWEDNEDNKHGKQWERYRASTNMVARTADGHSIPLSLQLFPLYCWWLRMYRKTFIPSCFISFVGHSHSQLPPKWALTILFLGYDQHLTSSNPWTETQELYALSLNLLIILNLSESSPRECTGREHRTLSDPAPHSPLPTPSPRSNSFLKKEPTELFKEGSVLKCQKARTRKKWGNTIVKAVWLQASLPGWCEGS